MGEEIVLITTKGEAIAIALACMNYVQIVTASHGRVASVKRCIMDRDLYPRKWGLGEHAVEKRKMKEQGLLDKYGRENENTPSSWKAKHPDLSNGAATITFPEPSKVEIIDEGDVSMAPSGIVDSTADMQMPTNGVATEEVSSKKKRKAEDETSEEKAERKRKKREEKEKRKSAA